MTSIVGGHAAPLRLCVDDQQGPDLYAFIGFIGYIGPDDDDIN